jgi:hypothetical protein
MEYFIFSFFQDKEKPRYHQGRNPKLSQKMGIYP